MRWLPLIITTLLLAGCAGGSGPVPPLIPPPAAQTTPQAVPPQTPAPAQTNGPLASLQPGPPAPATAPDGLAAIITPAPPATMERFARQPGEVAGRPGMYFMPVATGELEGWALTDDPNNDAFYAASADNRWVTVNDRSQSYLAHRARAAVYRWAREQAALVATQGESLLFLAEGHLWLARGGPEQAVALAVPIPAAATPAVSRLTTHAVFAPDGASLLVLTGHNLYHVETESGVHRLVREVPGPAGDVRQVVRQEVRLVAAPDQQTALLTIRGSTATPAGTQSESRFLRLSWTGAVNEERTAPVWATWSPDGRLLAATADLAGITKAVTMFAGENDEPLARVKEADFCTQGALDNVRWLSDSSGVIVRVAGGHGVLRPDGTLVNLAALAGTSAFRAPVPAPDRPGLFALGGTTVVDTAGQVVAAAVPHAEGNWIGVEHLDPWGLGSEELRFALHQRGGKGPLCGPLDLTPQVERAPFAAPGLVVQLPPGDCLNLRAGFSQEAPAQTCLPGGTRLYPAFHRRSGRPRPGL